MTAIFVMFAYMMLGGIALALLISVLGAIDDKPTVWKTKAQVDEEMAAWRAASKAAYAKQEWER